MKRVLIVCLITFFSVGVVWAEGTSEERAAAAEQAPAAVELAPLNLGGDLFAEAEAGGCSMPDLSGLSDEDAKAALIASGFEVSEQVQAQLPMCPVVSSCNSVGNCGVGSPCALSIVGPCCQSTAGVACCAGGLNIVKSECPCVCTSTLCSLQCAQTTQVRSRCR